VNYSTLPVHVAASVQSDLILPELYQHLFQRWTAFQHSIADELMEQWRIQASCFCSRTLNKRCNVG